MEALSAAPSSAANFHPPSARRYAPAIRRLKLAVVTASELAAPPAAYPQRSLCRLDAQKRLLLVALVKDQMEEDMARYSFTLSIGPHNRRPLSLVVSAILAIALAPEIGSAQNMTLPPAITAENEQDAAKEILERYAHAWRGKEEMDLRGETVLAFWVSGESGGEYHIILPQEGSARLLEGMPGSYTFGFEMDIDTLRRLDRGEWNAFTAMGQARGTDPIPLVPKTPEGFEWTPDNRGYFIPLLFHFWNRDWPERVLFGEGTTRLVHGANTTVFYYDKGLRSAWYQVKAGMHINADPVDQTNEFQTLVIMSRGAVMCRLGGTERVLREGEAVFIPAGMRHEFWAEPNQYGECIILMFGGGA